MASYSRLLRESFCIEADRKGILEQSLDYNILDLGNLWYFTNYENEINRPITCLNSVIFHSGRSRNK